MDFFAEMFDFFYIWKCWTDRYVTWRENVHTACVSRDVGLEHPFLHFPPLWFGLPKHYLTHAFFIFCYWINHLFLLCIMHAWMNQHGKCDHMSVNTKWWVGIPGIPTDELNSDFTKICIEKLSMKDTSHVSGRDSKKTRVYETLHLQFVWSPYCDN